MNINGLMIFKLQVELSSNSPGGAPTTQFFDVIAERSEDALAWLRKRYPLIIKEIEVERDFVDAIITSESLAAAIIER